MKITLISLRTEGSPSKFINNGSRQGKSRALGQISKLGEAAGAVFARQEVLLWFKPGLEAAGGHRGDGDGCEKQRGRAGGQEEHGDPGAAPPSAPVSRGSGLCPHHAYKVSSPAKRGKRGIRFKCWR